MQVKTGISTQSYGNFGLVADSGVLPIINTGIAHKKAGIGQIGAGITTAPMQCFNEAIAALAATLLPETGGES